MEVKTVEIEVTRDIIDTSRKSCPRKCAVAEAIQRKLSKNHIALVSTADVTIQKFMGLDRGWVSVFRYDLPRNVRSFIHKFDFTCRSHVEPICFEMYLPVEALADG